MAQDPFKVDQVQIEPGSGDTILINRHSDGSLKFKDAVVTSGLVLSQLANLSTIEGVYIVGRGGLAQYTTLQSALDVIPSGSSSSEPSLILMLPGVYTETITIIRDGLTIVGLGHVVIRSLLEETPDAIGATHTISILQSGTTPLRVDLVNLTITNSHTAKACIYTTGADILTLGLNLKDCVLDATSGSGNFTLSAVCVNRITIDGGRVGGGDYDQLKLYEVAEFEAYRVSRMGAVLCRWDNDATVPSFDPAPHVYRNCDVALNSTLQNSFILEDPASVSMQYCTLGDTTLAGVDCTYTFEKCVVDALAITALSTCNVVVKQTLTRSTLPSNSTATLSIDSLSGALVFSGSDVEDVVFNTPQPDSNYFLQLTVEGDSGGECPYVSAKSSTGFSISYNTNQTLTTRWRIFR